MTSKTETILPDAQIALLIGMIGSFGLRPVVNGLAQAAEDLLDVGGLIVNEYGEEMSEDDVRTFAWNLLRDMY